MHINKGRLNVLCMGVCFSFLFTSYSTMSNLEKLFILSVKDDTDGYTGDGYVSQAFVSITWAICLWFSPSVCNFCGAKVTMFLGALLYVVFMCSFFIPNTWVLYTASSLVGLGAGLLWTGQSAYLVLNSDQHSLETNLGLFFVFYQSGALLGNMFVYYQFSGKSYIDAQTRHMVTIFLSGLAVLGGIFMLFLPSYDKEALKVQIQTKAKINLHTDVVIQKKQIEDTALVQSVESPVQTFIKGWKILGTKEVLILMWMFCNIGFSVAYTIVYNSCLGFTRNIPNSIQMVPVAGLFSGVGGMLGGILPSIIPPEKNLPFTIRPLMLIGFICYVLSYCIAFINFPNSSVFGYTYESAIIESNAYLGIIGTFLLHLAETLYNNETAVILAKLFPNDTVSAFAIFMFSKNIFSALSFAGSNYIGLYYQLCYLGILLILGSGSFGYVSKIVHRRRLNTCIASVPLR